MKVYIDKNKKKIEKKFDGKVQKLLEELNINPETVIVVRDETLLVEDDLVKDSDNIKILSVVSGG